MRLAAPLMSLHVTSFIIDVFYFTALHQRAAAYMGILNVILAGVLSSVNGRSHGFSYKLG